jgi:hypothetical protein
MKHKLLMILAMIVFSSQANAGVVNVFGERYDLNVINNFYNSLPGHSSTNLGNWTQSI